MRIATPNEWLAHMKGKSFAHGQLAVEWYEDEHIESNDDGDDYFREASWRDNDDNDRPENARCCLGHYGDLCGVGYDPSDGTIIELVNSAAWSEDERWRIGNDSANRIEDHWLRWKPGYSPHNDVVEKTRVTHQDHLAQLNDGTPYDDIYDVVSAYVIRWIRPYVEGW
jgi:hypothetical protein